MAFTSDQGGRNYVLGRGKLFFDRFSAAQVAAGIGATTLGEGERFIGNVPEVTFNTTEETLDHFSSTGGVRTKDDSVTLQLDRAGNFSTDNIESANLVLNLLASGITTVTQTSTTAATYVRTVKRGRFYQIGQTNVLPTGVRGVSNIVVAKGASFVTNVVALNNWEVDEATGRIYILPAAADIPDDTEIQITYDRAAGTRDQVVSSSSAIYGALKWVADNPKGANKDMYIPYCKLSPDGDYGLVGDDWQSMSFSIEVLTKGNLGGIYIDGRQVA